MSPSPLLILVVLPAHLALGIKLILSQPPSRRRVALGRRPGRGNRRTLILFRLPRPSFGQHSLELRVPAITVGNWRRRSLARHTWLPERERRPGVLHSTGNGLDLALDFTYDGHVGDGDGATEADHGGRCGWGDGLRGGDGRLGDVLGFVDGDGSASQAETTDFLVADGGERVVDFFGWGRWLGGWRRWWWGASGRFVDWGSGSGDGERWWWWR